MILREVHLTGRAAVKEVRYRDLTAERQVLMDRAMSREWAKWTEFKAAKYISQAELDEIFRRSPNQQIVGTRWALTEKRQISRLASLSKAARKTSC